MSYSVCFACKAMVRQYEKYCESCAKRYNQDEMYWKQSQENVFNDPVKWKAVLEKDQKEGVHTEIISDEDLFLLAGKGIFDRLPFENPEFNELTSVNECADLVRKHIKEKRCSIALVKDLACAVKFGYPYIVSLSKAGVWHFLNIPNPNVTQEDFLAQVHDALGKLKKQRRWHKQKLF